MASSSSSSNAETGKILRRANPSTIQDKFLVGYQGWFTCAGDGEPIAPGHHGWLHWFDYPIPQGGRPNLDLWPDVSSYSSSELFPAPGLKSKSGEPVFLFSSRNAKTVQRHFHWMAEHGVDGAFLQRFVGQCDLETGNEGIRRVRDEVGDRVREAAEREGRVFAIMYDVTGVPADRLQRVLEQDWIHLLRDKGILDSPNYLKEKGKPVIALWGLGFENAGHTPGLVRAITSFLRNITPGGAYIMAGTPTHWRTSEGDADRNPEFVDVWLNEFDAISPWTIGRYKTEEEAESFAETKMKGDADLIKRRNEDGQSRKIDYIPVVFPGGSGYNLSRGKWGVNDIKRNGGRFLWRQLFNARRVGSRIIYGAMWDEYDEGTAFMPAVTSKRSLPVSDKYSFLALDEDGYDLPSDWYMRICGFGGEVLRSERRIFDSFPSKELQDYWGSRPKYEEVGTKAADFVSGYGASSSSAGASSSAGGSSSGDGGASYEEWLAQQREEKDEPPPPPYSLEAGEASPATAQSQPSTAVPPSTSGSSTSGIASSSTSTALPSAVPVSVHDYSASHLAAINPNQPHVADHTYSANPPPINLQTYPSAQGYGAPSVTGTAPIGAGREDPIVALTSNFGRHGISNPPSPGMPSDNAAASSSVPGRIPPTPPPPVHPAHPTTQTYGSYGRPTSRPQSQSTAPSNSQGQSRPHSQSRPQSSQSGYNPASAPPLPTNSPQWSQSQWPPADWQMGPSTTQTGSVASAPGGAPITGQGIQSHGGSGANLSRPQTFTASSYSSPNSSLRPNATIGPPRPASSRPYSPNSQAISTGPFPSANAQSSPYVPPASPIPSTGAPSTYHTPAMPSGPPTNVTGSGTPSYNPSGGSAFPGPNAPIHPSGSPIFPSGPNASNSYPPPVSSFPNSAYPPYYPNAHGSDFPSAQPAWSGGPAPHVSPPISPSAMGTFPNPSGYQGHGSSHQASHYGSSPMSHHASIHGGGGGPPFPQVPAGDGSYYNNSMPQSHSQHSSGHHASNFPTTQHGTPSSYQASSSSSYQSSTSPPVPSSSPWIPGGPGQSDPPVIPPRPSNYASPSSSSKPSGMNFPIASTGASALGFALSAVDRVAGRKTRDQLESQVGSIAQSGSKLFNKFTR